jgi:hypothetical protein
MIGIQGPVHLVVTIVTALAAMITFAAATQGYFIAKSRIWETACLVLIAFTLFRPAFWLDLIEPPYRLEDPARAVEVAGSAAPDGEIRLMVEGEDLSSGEMVAKTVVLPLGPAGDGAERLMEHAGIELRDEDGKVLIDNITFGSPADRQHHLRQPRRGGQARLRLGDHRRRGRRRPPPQAALLYSGDRAFGRHLSAAAAPAARRRGERACPRLIE